MRKYETLLTCFRKKAAAASMHTGHPASAVPWGRPASQGWSAAPVVGVALVVVGLASHAALAVPLTTLPDVVSFGGAVSVTDTKTPAGPTTNNEAAFPSIPVNKYNGPDILTGVEIQLTSLRTPGGTHTGTGGPQGSRNSSGTGSSTGQMAVPGASQAFASVAATASCTTNCTVSLSGAAQHANQTFTIATGLASYYGPGTFSATRTAPTLTATATGTANTISTTYTETWTGTLSTTYDYIKHATGSFASASSLQTLLFDFGTVVQQSTVQHSFSLFNLLDPAGMTAGLDLDSLSGTGDTTAFSLSNLLPFTNLAAGSQQSFLAALDTTQLGSYSATYLLHLSDADVGVGETTATLELTLTGQVMAAEPDPAPRGLTPTAAPEPSTWLLLATGCLSLLSYGWRRRQRVA